MAVQLRASEAAVLAYLFDHAPVARDARTFEYRAANDGAVQRVASIALTDDPALHLIATLGSRGAHVFVTVTDGAPATVAAALADLETYDATTPLAHGDTVPLDLAELRAAGRPAILLLRPAVSNALSELPDTAAIGDRRYHLLLVVFLAAAEYELVRARGLDALLDAFGEADRDLIALSAG